jgi:hypothetical protein
MALIGYNHPINATHRCMKSRPWINGWHSWSVSVKALAGNIDQSSVRGMTKMR